MLSRTPQLDRSQLERVREELWLLGQPPLADYIDFVRASVEGGMEADRRRLVDDWRAANDRYAVLERTEKGFVDGGTVGRLPAALERLAEDALAHPDLSASFDALPTTFGMVELDRLMVYQPHVTHAHVEALAARIGPSPDPATLLSLCLPTGRTEHPPVVVRRLSEQRWQFVSPSTDLRPHEVTVLPADSFPVRSFGPVAGAIALPVGFSVNCLSVVRSDGRLLLQNGYHRAVAMRRAGITHAPAIVQTVTRRDELNLVASARVADEPAFWFAAARPPLLKDFFDPTIARLLPVRRMERIVEVTLEIREIDVAAL